MSEPLGEIEEAMLDKRPARGFGHDFYTYPARMSPLIARALINRFSFPGDLVLDPFMGSGTTVVEALTAGRRAIGVDINPISIVLARARTTPLSKADIDALRTWSSVTSSATRRRDRWASLPNGHVLARLTESIHTLRFPRRQVAARAVLLRLGQWALDRRDEPPRPSDITEKAKELVEDITAATDEVSGAARATGVSAKQLTNQRTLVRGDATELGLDRRLEAAHGKVRLVVSSPPYPGVHVLYHRWQLRSRVETPAPYWLIQAQDGQGPAHYTLGGRSARGVRRYFELVEKSLLSLRPFLEPDALVCLVLAFRDPANQMPKFIDATSAAGFSLHSTPIWREVPNRKWYAKTQSDQSASREVLFILSETRPSQAMAMGLHATVARLE